MAGATVCCTLPPANSAAAIPVLHSSEVIAARATKSWPGFRQCATPRIPVFKPLFGIDNVTITLKGTESDDMVDFEGSALQMPGVAFKAVLTRISD